MKLNHFFLANISSSKSLVFGIPVCWLETFVKTWPSQGWKVTVESLRQYLDKSDKKNCSDIIDSSDSADSSDSS